MTELLIVSKPRGRIFKWIGGGVYKEYQSPVSGSKSDSVGSKSPPSGTDYDNDIWGPDESYDSCHFKTPNKQNLAIWKVTLRLKKVGSPTGTMYVEIWDDSGGEPGSKIGDVGSKDVSSLTTDYIDYTFTPGSKIKLDLDTDYWLVVHYNGGDSSNYISWLGVSDVDASYKIAWKSETGSWNVYTGNWRRAWIYFKFVDLTLQIDLNFIYSGTGEKRLQETVSSSNISITDVKVNGTSVGTSLTKEYEIEQDDNYTVVYYFDSTNDHYSLSVEIQRYLYYAKTSITLDDLNVSEAYLQEIEYGGDGGVLRIDDSPDSDLVGSANETIQFMDIIVPFRKLEWISGGGEVLIMGVE